MYSSLFTAAQKKKVCEAVEDDDTRPTQPQSTACEFCAFVSRIKRNTLIISLSLCDIVSVIHL